MKNQALENFQRALAALVGLLTIDKPTPIDTATFCGKHKMSAEHFFPALRQLDCVMLGPVQAKDKTSHILYLTRTNKLLSIDPDEVIAAVRRLSKTEKGEAIVWHSKEEEKAALSNATSTAMLTKALDQAQTLPEVLVSESDNYDVPLEEEQLADQPPISPVPAAMPTPQPIPTLEPEQLKLAQEFARQISDGLLDQPKKQLDLLQAVYEALRSQHAKRKQELQESAVNLIRQAQEFSDLARLYELGLPQ